MTPKMKCEDCGRPMILVDAPNYVGDPARVYKCPYCEKLPRCPKCGVRMREGAEELKSIPRCDCNLFLDQNGQWWVVPSENEDVFLATIQADNIKRLVQLVFDVSLDDLNLGHPMNTSGDYYLYLKRKKD